jgi:[calcium/calmodulin-dependent protein kinase] kinase
MQAILYQLLEALCYLHDTLHVAHMDIRPSNILITTSNATTIKLCDFNRASKLGSVLVCDGTPGYMAPELLMTMGITDGRPTDMWAVGATLYELCVGQPLLSVFTPTEGHLGIIRRGVDLHHIRDPMLQDLCHKLLMFDPGARITAAAALQHPFFLPTPRSTRSSGGGMRSSGGGGEHWLAACRIACRRRTKS